MRVLEITLSGSAQQVTTAQIYTPFVTFANNDATNSFTVGDNTVTATKGVVVPKGTTYTVTRNDNRILLKNYYVIGTAASKAEILYE
jgi:hypothetical protein